jgi:hypothetical protein
MKEIPFSKIENILEKLIKLFGAIDSRLFYSITTGEKKLFTPSTVNTGKSNIDASKDLILEAMKGSVSHARNILSLFGESESSVSRILGYFMRFLGFVNQGFSIGSFIGELFGFIPGGGLITGAIQGGGTAGSAGISNIIKPDLTIQPNITVMVQSEIEKTKAIKFLRNYNPAANARSVLSNL